MVRKLKGMRLRGMRLMATRIGCKCTRDSVRLVFKSLVPGKWVKTPIEQGFASEVLEEQQQEFK